MNAHATAGRTGRIGFVLLSNSRNPQPSTRIAVLNIFPHLRDAGFEPVILFEPETAAERPELPDLVGLARNRGVTTVVFQKVHGAAVEREAVALASAGIGTVYAVCDLVIPRMAAATDATVVVTEYLKSLYPPPLQAKIQVVHDGIEHPEIVKTDSRNDRGSSTRPLHAVLVTSQELHRLPAIGEPPPWLRISIVGRYPSGCWRRLRQDRWTLGRLPGMEQRLDFLRFLADRRIRRIAWHPSRVYDHLRRADLAIIPIDRSDDDGETIPAWKVKSENRLTMKMSIGLPVIATPIPAYLPIIDHGRNGFLAESPAAWRYALETLRDPEHRRRIGAQARISVIERYSIAAQARRMIDLLERMHRG